MFKWTKEKENLLLELREQGKTFSEISSELQTTEASVKHKYKRIGKKSNEDKYKHTNEKKIILEVALRHFDFKNISVLETHAGYGGMTEIYSEISKQVTSIEIEKEKVIFIAKKRLKNVRTIKSDSEEKIFELITLKNKFDIIDIDPYGFPSRFFPHVLKLFKKDGLLFLTFPALGVANLNKITQRHYKVFWNINCFEDKEIYIEKIKEKLFDYGFIYKKELEILSVTKLDRVYRFAIRVQEKSLLDIVGLEVEGKNK